MTLNFKEIINNKPTNFIEKIKNGCRITPSKVGVKIHSLRKGCRWKEGQLIHFTTGARTKFHKCHFKLYCESVQNVVIEYNVFEGNIDIPIVVVDERILSKEEVLELAIIWF